MLWKKRSASDFGRWHKMLPFAPAQMPLVEDMVHAANRIDSRLVWQVTSADGTVLARLPATEP